MRNHLGTYTSGALPLLWAELRKRGQSHADVARALELHPGMVAKLLYGDRKPGRALSVKLRDVYGIRIETWDDPCPEGWLPHPPAESSSSLPHRESA